MEERTEDSRTASALEATLELSGEETVVAGLEASADRTREPSRPGAPRVAPRAEIVEGSGPRLSAETRDLLRGRLRALAAILLLAFGLFFVRDLFTWLLHDLWFVFCHVLVLALLTAEVTITSSRRPLSLRALRTLELAIVVVVMAFFALMEYRYFLRFARENNPVGAMALIKNIALFVFASIALYGAYIPNTWRRTAWVVVPMALTPSITALVLLLAHPEIRAFTVGVVSFQVISDNALVLMTGSVAAIYAAQIIHQLRAEVYEARRLGQYRLGRLIGAGGMGDVYLAEHQWLKRPCAIKLIRPGRAADPAALARFEREVRSTARLTHPNTIAVYDYGRAADGTFYYAMEYLDGLSLADLVARHGPLSPGRVIYLLDQVCGALGEAHAAGLIHRDIKPANIFAARRGDLHDFAKLLDFGLVKPMADPGAIELSRDRAITGSPLYMAPEQAAGQDPPDPRSDLYAVGAVAYFLLTARPPFPGQSVVEVLVALSRDPVIPPSRFRPDLPPDLNSVVLRCLARNPADRYPNASALARALSSCSPAGSWNAQLAAAWWQTHEPPPVAVAIPA